ncbi:MAG: hypothetical protein ACK4MV_03330 [Beijerinckiaceae bacterium]
MVDIRLGSFDSDFVVLHFGGPRSEIEADTLANVLKSFSLLSYSVVEIIDPESIVDFVVVSDGSGSYRILIRRIRRRLGGFLTRGAETVFWSVVATILFNATIGTPEKPNIIINSNEVIIEHEGKKYIVPRNVHNDASNASKAPKVQDALTQTFDALAADKKVTDFGLTPKMSDKKPLIQIPRSEFPVSTLDVIATEPTHIVRVQSRRATLVIRKAWLNGSKRKWSFEWNGVPISARIADLEFVGLIANRGYLLGSGDALDVDLMFKQVFDPAIGVYVNDVNSFIVTRVYRVIENLPHPQFS